MSFEPIKGLNHLCIARNAHSLIWHDIFSCICGSVGRQFKRSVDTLIGLLEISLNNKATIQSGIYVDL